jgi:hypothetical protein
VAPRAVGTASHGASKILRSVKGKTKSATGGVERTTGVVDKTAAPSPGPVGGVTRFVAVTPRVAKVRRTLTATASIVRTQLEATSLFDRISELVRRLSQLVREHRPHKAPSKTR